MSLICLSQRNSHIMSLIVPFEKSESEPRSPPPPVLLQGADCQGRTPTSQRISRTKTLKLMTRQESRLVSHNSEVTRSRQQVLMVKNKETHRKRDQITRGRGWGEEELEIRTRDVIRNMIIIMNTAVCYI